MSYPLEITAYVAVLTIASTMCLRDRFFSDGAMALVAVVVFAALSLVVRLAGYEVDAITYASRMALDPSSMMIPYYLREPVVWFGLSALHRMLGSDLLVFWVSDIATYGLVLAAMLRAKAPQFAIISVIAFFPFILGMQNVYRQWVASALLLYAVASAEDGDDRGAMIAFLLAVLSHNASAIFLGAILSKSKNRWSPVAFYLSAAAVPVMVLLGGGTKSSAETGANTSLLYVLINLVVLAVFLAKSRGGVGKHNVKDFRFFAYMCWVSILGAAMVGSAPSERLSMIALFIAYPYLARNAADTFKEKCVVRLALTWGGFLPLMFTEARLFIL